MEAHKKFAYNLKKFRIQLKISQEELASKLGITQGAISFIESGKTYTYKADFLENLHKLTGIPLEAFFAEIEEEELPELEKQTKFRPAKSPLKKNQQVRRIPSPLFVGARIEMRDMIRDDGFHPRVDMFTTPDEVINFLGGPPCDVYEINSAGLRRSFMEKNNHPLWTLYNYHNHIPYERVIGMTTYR